MILTTPVILCGGSGARLWPLSRSGFPKQFLSLTGEQSLFQMAALRSVQFSNDAMEVDAPLVVTNEEHRFLVTEQLREVEISDAKVLLEPKGRNTAPAMTFAALEATANNQDPVLVVMPADQIITEPDAFAVAVQKAVIEAASGNVVILGVNPTAPETGYGYIQKQISEPNIENIFGVLRFVEKPDQDKAVGYLENGDYYWNAGMFVVKASIWLQMIERFRKDIFQATEKAWGERINDLPFIRPGKAEFLSIPSESIDYAVMEKLSSHETKILKMVQMDAGWSDLGAWDAVWNIMDKDINGNAHFGDVVVTDSCNTLVHASNRLVSLVGVEDLIVIETADAVMVADKNRSQDVKAIVKQLYASGREEHALHRKVPRPWGWFDSIDEEDRFTVKRIQVKPGASLSLQKHYHRAEHWIVVKGTAEITCGDEVALLTENQSTYIPLGAIHRLANPGSIPLEVIEVQSGSYLGEDDIARFEDDYGR